MHHTTVTTRTQTIFPARQFDENIHSCLQHYVAKHQKSTYLLAYSSDTQIHHSSKQAPFIFVLKRHPLETGTKETNHFQTVDGYCETSLQKFRIQSRSRVQTMQVKLDTTLRFVKQQFKQNYKPQMT